MRARARKGIGREHSKWSPVCVATYQFTPSIIIDELIESSLNNDQKKSFVDSCPTRVYGLVNQGNERIINQKQGEEDDEQGEGERMRIIIDDEMKCMYCMECVNKADKMKVNELVSVNNKPNNFIFTVETNGSLPPESIVLTALEVLNNKLINLQTEISNNPNLIKHEHKVKF